MKMYLRWIVTFGLFCQTQAQAQTMTKDGLTIETTQRKALLLEPFLKAVDAYVGQDKELVSSGATSVFYQAFVASKIDPVYLVSKFQRSLANNAIKKHESFQLQKIESNVTETSSEKVAIHAHRFDVVEEYDDYTNDDIFLYFIVTHGDLVWGRTSKTYTNLDQGTSFLFGADDRAIFGPKGAALEVRDHVIVDVGIMESDGDDLTKIKKLSDIIIGTATTALNVAAPDIGAVADVLRGEVNNLLSLIASLDADDRMATDSYYFTPSTLRQGLGSQSFYEVARTYKSSTFFTAFDYKLHLRVLKPTGI